MIYSCDTYKKKSALYSLIFWIPLLYIDIREGDCGGEYTDMVIFCMILGIAFPLAVFFLGANINISISGIDFNPWFLGLFFSFLAHCLMGIISHFAIKSKWGEGIL